MKHVFTFAIPPKDNQPYNNELTWFPNYLNSNLVHYIRLNPI